MVYKPTYNWGAPSCIPMMVYFTMGHTLFSGAEYGKIIWLVVDLPLWKMMDFASWDYDIPNIWKNKIHCPNHQPVIYSGFSSNYVWLREGNPVTVTFKNNAATLLKHHRNPIPLRQVAHLRLRLPGTFNS